MPTRHFLNALRSDEGADSSSNTRNTLPPPDRGVWSTEDEFLRNYADSVEVSGNLSIKGMAHSVPSVFQRPIQFVRMIQDEDNPLHNAVVSEWRGLMATFCLKEWLKLDVKVKLFEVPNVEETEQSYVGAEDCGDLHFRAALRNQMPQRPKSDPGLASAGVSQQIPERKSDWEKWWMIYCNNQLLGATSPWSLVYTASQYRTPAAIPWQENGLLIDPNKY